MLHAATEVHEWVSGPHVTKGCVDACARNTTETHTDISGLHCHLKPC